ncbi:hypothetical protein ISF_05679 [Cordyceps fumosorosea ARSEF 2679]|uniref:Uncharacterized protein n=1 Tax=Cordyceps fumosorosea (strain ARSEF 2679) TaxID=1081104 RepID=A0A167TIS9_CORFA|nr:hypothetical protein ISF_05679 [Cordyceps fumosorosea ARSEF 2679]OAA60640.1 hypothetical protein ISF_05679 [Cordyceps fumosorosea ARSEF 2679]
MSDASVDQLKVELNAAEEKRTVLKQEWFGIHAEMVQKKAALDCLKNTHDPSPTSTKYLKHLEIEGAIAELMQKEEIINEAIRELEENIMLFRYRIEQKKK